MVLFCTSSGLLPSKRLPTPKKTSCETLRVSTRARARMRDVDRRRRR
jgi:hypothetical protein